MNITLSHSFPVPLFRNTSQNNLSFSIRVVSDISCRRVSFYECDGVYWFCLEHCRDINSVGFVSLRNCVSSLRETIKVFGFAIEDNDGLNNFVRRWEHSLKSSTLRKGVS